MDSPPASLKGQFLIAMPSLGDPNFAQTVTCISEHSAAGAMGIIVNRRHEYLRAKEIFEELNIPFEPEAGALPIHLGGPVHMDEIFILHGPPLVWQGSLPVGASLAMSNSMDLLKAISRGQGPRAVLISLGCAGWAPGQLEAELAQNAWLTTPVDDAILFEVDIDHRWEAALNQLGIDPSVLSGTAGHA